MAQGPLYRVQFRRRREGRTDYRKRLALLKSGVPRAVVRRSNKNVTVQFVTYDETGDRVVAQAEARELLKMGWTGGTSNLPAAYLTGLLAGKRFLEADAGEEAILDLGRQYPHKGGVVFAALAGLVESGAEVPAGDVFPDEDRLQGKHISEETAAAFAATFEKIAGRAFGAGSE